jgi:hypothetical protein
MSESVSVSSKQFPGFFLLAAITRAKAIGDKIHSSPVEVTFTANGVELPFVDTLNDLYERMENEIDGRARKIAEQMIQSNGLETIHEAISDLEAKIKEAIDRVVIKDTGEPKSKVSYTLNDGKTDVTLSDNTCHISDNI